MSQKLFSLFCAAGLSVLSAGAHADDARLLMLHDAAYAAYLNSPDILAARENLKAVQELYPQAIANWHPSLNASAGVTVADIDDKPASAEDGTVSKDASISLDQPLWRGGRSVAQKKEAKNRIDAAHARLVSVEQSVLSRAMTAGIDVVYREKDLALQMRNEENFNRLADAIARRRAAGEATDTDNALAQTRLERASAARISAQNALDAARTVFEEVTLMQPQRWQQVQFPALPLPVSKDEATALSRTQNPDIAEQVFLMQADQNRIDVVGGELLPVVTASASYSRQWDPQPGTLDETETTQAGVRATVPLYEGGAVRSRVRQAKNNAMRQKLDARSVHLSVERDVVNAYRDMVASGQRAAIHARETAAAEIARHNTEQEVFAGEKTLTDLLQVDQDWLDAGSASLLAWRDEAFARIRLAALLSLLTPQNIGFEAKAYDTERYADKIRNRYFSTSVSAD